jgi:hypothetical protein
LQLLCQFFPYLKTSKITHSLFRAGFGGARGQMTCWRATVLQTDLSVPIIDADKRLLDVLRNHCTEVLAKHRKRPPSLIETVERLIVDRLSNAEVRIDIVAKELAMSSRACPEH